MGGTPSKPLPPVHVGPSRRVGRPNTDRYGKSVVQYRTASKGGVTSGLADMCSQTTAELYGSNVTTLALDSSGTLTAGACTPVGWRPNRTVLPDACVGCGFVGVRPWQPPPDAVMLVGCIRRSAETLRSRVVPYIDAMLPRLHGADDGASMWVCEDDTEEKDPTRALLRAWARRNQRVRLVLPRPPASWTRERRLALCRNALLAEARASLPAASGVLVALDLDCALPAALPAAVADLRGASGWEVATANSPGHYRDKWALRSSRLGLAYDCWQDNTKVNANGNCFDHAIRIDADAPPLLAESAFNGVGLYKASALRPGCAYAGVQMHGKQISEHVPFHLCLGRGGASPPFAAARIAIVPSLLVDCFPPRIQKGPRRVVAYGRNGTLRERRPSALPYELRKLPLAQGGGGAKRGGWVSWVYSKRCRRSGPATAAGGDARCWEAHPAFDLKVLNSETVTMRQRCERRHATAEEARRACLATPWCDGITKDGGMRCEVVED